MVEKIGITQGAITPGMINTGYKEEFQGLSTDTKPTNCYPGSTYYELDSTNGFIFGNNQWWPA